MYCFVLVSNKMSVCFVGEFLCNVVWTALFYCGVTCGCVFCA